MAQIVKGGDNEQRITIQRDRMVGRFVFGPERRMNRLFPLKQGMEIPFQDTGRMYFDRELTGRCLKAQKQLQRFPGSPRLSHRHQAKTGKTKITGPGLTEVAPASIQYQLMATIRQQPIFNGDLNIDLSNLIGLVN